MHATKKPLRFEWCWVLAALMLLVGVRIVQAIRSEVLTPDGIVYVRMAQQWGDDPSRVIDAYDYHVAYPVLVSATHSLMDTLGLTDAPDAWDRAGQVVSIIAAVGALLGVWYWSRLLMGPGVALLTLVIFGLGKKWVAIGSDVLSDSLSACCQIWAIAISYIMLDQLNHHRRRAIAWAALAGVLIGAGYLVRPESLLILMVALPLGLLVWGYERVKPSLALATLGVVATTTILTALPYMLAIGGLTKKKNLGDMIRRVFTHSQAEPSMLAMALPAPLAAVVNCAWQILCAVGTFVAMMTEAIHPIAAGLALSWVIAWVLFRRKPYWTYPTPKRLAGLFIFLLGVGLFALNALLLGGHGYMSHRHTLIAVLAVTPLIGAGVFSFTGLLRRGIAAMGLPTLSAQATFWLFALALPAIMIAHALAEPPHAGKGAYRQAAYDIASHCTETPPRGPVLADEAWIRHYVRQTAPAVRHAEPTNMEDLSAEDILALAAEHNASFIVLRSSRQLPDAPFRRARYVAWTPYPSGSKMLYVYERQEETP